MRPHLQRVPLARSQKARVPNYNSRNTVEGGVTCLLLKNSVLLGVSKLNSNSSASHYSQDRVKAVEEWVMKLKGIARDADDVMDEFDYEVVRRKVELQNHMKKKGDTHSLTLWAPVPVGSALPSPPITASSEQTGTNNSAKNVGEFHNLVVPKIEPTDKVPIAALRIKTQA